MKHFVNEYKYTSDVIEEGVSSWWKWKFRKLKYAMLISIPLIVIFAFISKDFKNLEFEIIPILMLVMLKIKTRSGIKTEKNRKKVIYPNEDPIIHVEIGEDIKLASKNSNRNITFSNVEAIAETESLIILFIEGMMTVTLSKDGFIEGTAEECLSYLREKTAKK